MLCAEAADEGHQTSAGVEEIPETDDDDLPGASQPPLGSQHDEGEESGPECRPSAGLAFAGPSRVDSADASIGRQQEHTRTGGKQALGAADETAAEPLCMVCGFDLSGQSLAQRERHLNLCLDRSQHEGGGRAGGAHPCHQVEDDPGGCSLSQFQCAICSENMAWWSEEQRAVHVNQCCDAMLQANAAASSKGTAACANELERREDMEAFKSPKSAIGAGRVCSGAPQSNMLVATYVKDVLRQLGLERYADALYNANVRDLRSLARLTEGEMRQLGLSVGARKRLLSEQTALRSRVDAIGVIGVNRGSENARANAVAFPNRGAVDDVEVARALAVAEAAKAGRNVGAALPKGPRLKRVGQEIRDAMPERTEAKGHRKQLLLTATRKDGWAGDRVDDSEGCSQVALALALSASVEGHMSERMRRRREVARNLAEVCLCGEAEQSEVDLLLLELIPPRLQDEDAQIDGGAGLVRHGGRIVHHGISLPHSRLSCSSRGLGGVGKGDDEGGECQSLWNLSALCPPQHEEQVALFYNGLLGKRSLSQLESRPHVFDMYGAQPRGANIDEVVGGDIGEVEMETCAADDKSWEEQQADAAVPATYRHDSESAAAGPAGQSVLESGTAGVVSSSAMGAERSELVAGTDHGSPSEDRVDRLEAARGECKGEDAEEKSRVCCSEDVVADATGGIVRQGVASGTQNGLLASDAADDIVVACKLPGTPLASGQQGSQQEAGDESEFCVPDSEDEDAEPQAQMQTSRGVASDMTMHEVAPPGSVAGGLGRAEGEAGAQDKGMLSQLLMHMSDSEDEGVGETTDTEGGASANCRQVARKEAGVMIGHRTQHPAVLRRAGSPEGGEGGGLSEVLPLVHKKLLDMSPQTRAAAKSAIEHALGTAVEVARM